MEEQGRRYAMDAQQFDLWLKGIAISISLVVVIILYIVNYSPAAKEQRERDKQRRYLKGKERWERRRRDELCTALRALDASDEALAMSLFKAFVAEVEPGLYSIQYLLSYHLPKKFPEVTKFAKELLVKETIKYSTGEKKTLYDL